MALELFQGAVLGRLNPTTATYNVLITACEKGQNWQLALRLSHNAQGSNLLLDAGTYCSAIMACDKG